MNELTPTPGQQPNDDQLNDGYGSSNHNDPQTNSHDTNGRARQRRVTAPIPDERECLAALLSLNKLILLGVLTPARASAIRANLREILDYHRRNCVGSSSHGTIDVDLFSLAQRDPNVLSALGPLVDDAQFDSLFQNATEQ